MAGWKHYDQDEGWTYGLYERPFVIRAVPKSRGFYDRPEATTITSFRTLTEAESWLARNATSYKAGPHGFASLHVENWNI